MALAHSKRRVYPAFFSSLTRLDFFLALTLVIAFFAPFSSLASLVLLSLAGLTASSRHLLSSRPGLAWLIAAWLLWLPFSLTWALSPGFALFFISLLLCLPLAWLLGRTLQERDRLTPFLRAVVPTALAGLVAWGIWQGTESFTGKPQGPYMDPNTYAGVLNLLLLPVLARYLAADLVGQAAWRRGGHLALLAGAAFAYFLAASRGATLAFLLVLPPLLWLARNTPHFKHKLALLGVVTLTAYFAAYTVSGGLSVATRLANTLGSETSEAPRILLLKSAWSMIQDHPWLGTGLGSFRDIYPRYRLFAESTTGGGWVHNDYLQLWVEAGLPMLLLLLGIAAWVAWTAWRTLRDGREDALERMGYLAAIAAVMIHALVNFLLYFTLVTLMLGLYLARTGHQPAAASAADGKNARAFRFLAGGYVVILGWLMLGQVAVESLLEGKGPVKWAVQKGYLTYPRYETAHGLSILAPLVPAPQANMGVELADAAFFAGGNRMMLNEALQRMDAAWQRGPCHLVFANTALAMIGQYRPDPVFWSQGVAMAQRSLDCNPRHGLSYYYAGRFSEDQTIALQWWRAGLAASPFLGDKLLLASAILGQTTPEHTKALSTLAGQMAEVIRRQEASPSVRADQVFWGQAQQKLYYLTGGENNREKTIGDRKQ